MLLWGGQTVSTFGNSISALALPLLVLALTRSPAQAGLLAAVEMLPYLLLSLPAGVLIDRWDRKRLMIWCDVARWLAFGSVPLAFALGWLTVPQLYLVAAVAGVGEVFFSVSQVSALPQVVSEEHLPRAVALNETAEAGAQLFGPGLVGFIVGLARTTAAGAVLAYLVNSLSYLTSVLTLLAVRVPFQGRREASANAAATRPPLRREIGEGLRFLWEQRGLRLLAALGMAYNALTAPLALTLIVLTQDRLHLSVEAIGLIFSAGGVGSLLGGLLAPSMKARLTIGQMMLVCNVVRSLAVLLLALSDSPPLLALGLGVFLLAWPPYAVAVITYRLTLVPDALVGRVTSAFRVLTYGVEPLGAALGGVLVGALGPRPVLWAITLGIILTAIWTLASDARRL